MLLIPLVLYLGYWLDGEYILYGVGISVILIALGREIDRRGTHANAVLLSRKQFPEIYEIVDDFAGKLALKRVPDVYVIGGDGVLNAFSAESCGKSYIVLHSELFSDQSDSIKDGLAFIIGHELGHITEAHQHLLHNPAAPLDVA